MACKVNNAAGGTTITPTFNFSSTYGQFYFQTNRLSGAFCLTTSIPMSATAGGAPYQLPIPAQSIAYPLAIAPSTPPPSTPTLSCPSSATVGQPSSFILSNGTDPSGLPIRYGIDWLNSGSVNGWLPSSGYVPSGSSETASYTFAAPGTYTVKALTENSSGTDSPWTSCTVPVTSGPTNGSCAPSHYACTAGTSANAVSGASSWSWQCAGLNGGATASCSEQKPPTVISFTCGKNLATSASSCTVNSGQPTNLFWTSTPGTSCTSPGFSTTGGSPVSTGPLTVNPTSYSLTCIGPNNAPSTANVNITVNQPAVSISASPDRVNPPGSSTISWDSTLTSSCTVSGPGLSSTQIKGNKTVTITSQSTYTISCTTAGNPVSDSVIVNVTPKFNEF